MDTDPPLERGLTSSGVTVMQKLLPLLAVFASMVSPVVHAQSSVAVYGLLDVYGQYLDGTSRLVRLQSGGTNGSRLGFRGTEDLGDGFKALFTLEMGLNADDGTFAQGGIAFGRQAFVGLSDRWGELTLGRQYGSTYRLGSDFNAFGIGAYSATAQVIGGFAGGYEPFRGAGATAVAPAAGATGNGSPARINNSIRYASPSWDGLQATAMAGLGEVAGGTNDNRILDFALRYDKGPLRSILFYVTDKRTTLSAAANTSTSGIGATYLIGAAYKVYAGYISVNDKRPENEDGRGYWLAGEYRWNTSHLVRAEWMQNKPRYGADNTTNVFALGYQYDLSKRTALYTTLTRFKNGANAGTGRLGRFNSAVPLGLTGPGDSDISEFTAGMRHIF
jgi:predicted porin